MSSGRPNAAKRAAKLAKNEPDNRSPRYVEAGRRLNLEVIDEIDALVAATREGRLELQQRGAEMSADEKREVRARMMTNMDLLSLSRDLQDRFGQPRRSQAEVELATDPDTILRLPPGLWEAPLAAGAAGDGHAGNGNGSNGNGTAH